MTRFKSLFKCWRFTLNSDSDHTWGAVGVRPRAHGRDGRPRCPAPLRRHGHLCFAVQFTLYSQNPVHFLREPPTYIVLNRMALQHFNQNEKSDDFHAL